MNRRGVYPNDFVPRRRPLSGTKDVLSYTFKKYGLKQDLRRYRFVLDWPKIVGAEAAKRCFPEYLRKGSLVVRVKDSVWAQELSLRKHLIIEQIQEFLDPGDEVTDLYFVVAD